MSVKFFVSVILVIACVALISDNSIAATKTDIMKDSMNAGPECWSLAEKITFTGEKYTNQPHAVIQRVSVYEIHDDDSVNPNHTLTNLPYYDTYTWQGSADVEWLEIEGGYSYYEINDTDHTVTFYGLQDWLHIVYRTENFILRSPDQVRFCVIGQNGGDYYNTQVKVLYPGKYQFLSATPAGYTIPAAGEIDWGFGEITEFQVDTYFSGLGPDRPLLDLPVDYEGRSTGSSTGFNTAFKYRITSKFDHYYPYLTKYSWNCADPSTSIQHDDKLTDFTGEPIGPPGNICECKLWVSSYDGHNGYDIDDTCPPKVACDSKAVYTAAEGDIIASQTGWNNVLGCRIVIDHGDDWVTTYNHLADSKKDHSCDGILVWSGHVTRLSKIGIIGGTGSGGGGDNNAHLHFTVTHEDIAVDPSGWEPNPQVNPDPWALHQDGTTSYPMWLYSIRTTLAVDPQYGAQLASPTHDTIVDVPIGFYSEPLMFNLSSLSIGEPSPAFAYTGNSFSLTAADDDGNSIHQLDEYLTVNVSFQLSDVEGIVKDTLSLFTWDEDSDSWKMIPTIIDWDSLTATAQTNHLSIFALFGKSANATYLPMAEK